MRVCRFFVPSIKASAENSRRRTLDAIHNNRRNPRPCGCETQPELFLILPNLGAALRGARVAAAAPAAGSIAHSGGFPPAPLNVVTCSRPACEGAVRPEQ